MFNRAVIAETAAGSLTVETIDNHIYFYAEVDADRTLALMRAVRELDARLRGEHLSRSLPNEFPPIPIWLHIQSPGGEVFAGLGAADQLAAIHTPVYSIIEGVCASAATLISMACARRYILPNAFMLVHQLSGGIWGTHEQFKDEVLMQKMVMKHVTKFYAERSKLNKAAVREMLKRDSWMDAEIALKRGFVDEIAENGKR